MFYVSLAGVVVRRLVLLTNRFERVWAGIGGQAGPVAPVVVVLEPEGHAVLL